MNDRFQYRLTKNKKSEIAQNLIDFLQKDAKITELHEQTREFIYNWIGTGADEKRKAFFDVWDIVLKNYLPTTKPILFRSCKRLSKKSKIASFTGRLECARRFSEGTGYLIICDTKENLKHEDIIYEPGKYKNTFFPLVSILVKAKKNGGCGFTETFLKERIGEDEYIMRINLENMHSFEWRKNEL